MNIFVVTDNKWWLGKINKLFSDNNLTFSCFCSPKGAELFDDEIKSGIVTVIDFKKQYNDLLKNFNIGFSIHCKQIFPAELVNSIRCINIHPGLNPYNRGWFPQVFSIINKKPVGATIHIMDEQIDHGDVLFQEEVCIYEWDTSKAVYDRVLEAEYSLLESNIKEIVNGSAVSSKMSEEGNYNSIKEYNKIREIDLDRQLTMREAIDYLRAMTHQPYKNAYFYNGNGERIFVSIELEKDSRPL